jgi:acetyl-CoA synthetase
MSHNCLDVHLESGGDKVAMIFEGEPGDVRKLTYRELHAKCAGSPMRSRLWDCRGDRVVIYMPLIPEAVIAMQACARIGAVHSVVFGGFSANAVKDRIEDTGAKLVITADGGWRGGNVIELKRAGGQGAVRGCPTVQNVIVYRRTAALPMRAGRDIWWHDAVAGQEAACEPSGWTRSIRCSCSIPRDRRVNRRAFSIPPRLPAQRESDRRSGTFDLKDDDVYWCTADVGWVTGHTYVAYGPLAAGATVVMYEGAPMFPDGGRFWKICQDHGVTIFYTAPTAIRALMKVGRCHCRRKYDLRKLRLLGSVGEPINPEAWMWYHKVIGGERCPIVDTWWQTETGAIMISPMPA